MVVKKDSKAGAKAPAKAPKKKEGSGGGAKKKKWSKGKSRDQLDNKVFFDQATYGRLYSEVPNYRLITPSIVSERLKVRGSLARQALLELQEKGLIRQEVAHRSQLVYTRVTKDIEEEEVAEIAQKKPQKKSKRERAAERSEAAEAEAE